MRLQRELVGYAELPRISCECKLLYVEELHPNTSWMSSRRLSDGRGWHWASARACTVVSYVLHVSEGVSLVKASHDGDPHPVHLCVMLLPCLAHKG